MKLFSIPLYVEKLDGGFAVSSPGSTERLKTSLYGKHRDSFFGLPIEDQKGKFVLSSLDAIDLLPNPSDLYEFYGHDAESVQHFEAITKAATLWNKPDLWEHVGFDVNSIYVSASDDEAVTSIVETAILQKARQAAFSYDDLVSLQDYFKNGGWPIHKVQQHPDIHVALRLMEPDDSSDEWTLETVIRGVRSSSYWAPALKKRSLPIEQALPAKWEHLSDVVTSFQRGIIPFVSLLEEESETFYSIGLDDMQVRDFLRHDLAKLQAFGYDVVLPAWLKEIKESKMQVRASASTSRYKSAAGLEQIIQFNWNFSLGGQEISEDQFRQMVEENRSFIRSGDQWFQIDAQWIQEIRKLLDRSEEEEWTVRDLLFQELPDELTLAADEEDEDDPLIQFQLHQSLETYLNQLQEKKAFPEVPPSPRLLTELRPYQQLGLNWLAFMRSESFGAILADDMGLGKTIQLIAYLLHVHEQDAEKPSLIICPTSVLGNWQKELEKFAPSLRVATHYGSNRGVITTDADVVLTTYGIATQDAETLQQIAWSSVTLDEAQNIKNMQTKQSRAIRKLRGVHHIALTGTPVENRLSELWAIFDFIHKGYLGSFKSFQDTYMAPIERDEDEQAKDRLRVKIQPFLLRRTKRDPDLQLNLPEKLEQKEYCALTTEQAALYESLIQESVSQLGNLSGFQRKGLVLKMLSKLKQLCNHPALYLKEPFDEAEVMLQRSAKLAGIVSLAGEIAARGEQCLIFTQYIGMGHLLQHCFSELYDIDSPFLTGSMPKGQRDHLVASFQASEFPIFLLSLKAGGTGLNLTAATHVIHADRWWNPAVENQATDRAYRIGQQQFVHVHKFLTIGTIEEKIDALLEQKQSLSDELIHSSQWITELSDDELTDLLSLS